jgi:hypothetical protein
MEAGGSVDSAETDPDPFAYPISFLDHDLIATSLVVV